MDSNLLKEAIADAKAVRQTALANAKVALEEAFTEKYKAMFAEKLKEEAEQDEVHVPQEEETRDSSEETVSEKEVEDLIRELESEVGEEPPAEPMGATDAGQGAVPPPAVPGAVPPPAVPGAVPPPAVPSAVPPPAVPGTVPPLAVPGTVPQLAVPGTVPPPAVPGTVPPPAYPSVGAMPSPEYNVPQTEPSAALPPSDEPSADATEEDEELDLNELLEELKKEINSEEEEEEEEEENINEVTKLKSSEIGGGKAGGSPNKNPQVNARSTSKIESADDDNEGMPEIDQPKTTAKDPTEVFRPNKGLHATKENQSTPGIGKGNGVGGQTETGMATIGQPKTTAKDPTQATRPNMGKNVTKTNQSTSGGMLEENQSLRKQLNEAEEVIRYVKGQLNDVNLLNAKLLYTNKLFKEYNLTNEQKMRIVEMFDLARSIREVKMTYANTAETLNFGANDVRKKKLSANIQAITESLASQPVRSTKPNTKIITEASNMAVRFQKLAGIKRQ